jgi:hypothetical protein
MRHLSFTFIVALLLLGSCAKEKPVLKIGLVADPQYADIPTSGKRHYKESLQKLTQAIDTFNHHEVDFVQNLGDVIDRDWSSYRSILPIYEALDPQIENYHLLGNHDFSFDSIHMNQLIDVLSMPAPYYSFVKKGWRFIVLDVTDYAYYSNPLHRRYTSQIDSYFNLSAGQPNHQRWNGGIGEEQQNWLQQEIDAAAMMDEKVILFAHMPLRPLEDAHNLWNNEEIIDILEMSSNVVAYINGHNHAGGYDEHNGIHYITIFGMVDTTVGSFGILEIYEDSLIVNGFGNQKTLRLAINR